MTPLAHALAHSFALALALDEVPEPQPAVTFSGYAEAYYQWNANAPSNGVTAFRGFDNRHNALTLENAVLAASWDREDVVGNVALQVGAAPSSYYLAEPSLPGSASANATGPELFQHIQQANVGYRFPILQGLLVRAGVFLSPIGPESIAIKDDWFWSRSDLFFGLPFYHSGVWTALAVDEHWTAGLMVTNGWNTVVDNNDGKSVMAHVLFSLPDLFSAQVLYFGGPERAKGAAEGDGAWRSLLDAWVTWTVTERLSLQAQADAGLEANAFGASTWVAGALAARARIVDPWLFVAARLDGFRERAAPAASRIFWPTDRVGSATGTLELRPADHVSFFFELRHDHASGDMYFGGDVRGDGVTAAFVANRAWQDTCTLGAVGWF